MKICFNTSPHFKRRLKVSEEAEYSNVLKQGRDLVSDSNNGKSMLIVPGSSLPQNNINNTGIGNLASEESLCFFDFAKKYWGINEVQLLPIGQYHEHRGVYPLYSGTSMDFGNHIIDVKSILPKDSFNQLVSDNKIADRVNFSNIVGVNSNQEKLLKSLFNDIPNDMKNDFELYKKNNYKRLSKKGIFRALREIYGSANYKNWSKIDSNLFDERIVPISEREKRIAEILKTNQADVDFYFFKQFLAEKSFLSAKEKLNTKGLKLNGDMLCGFSFDEIWANPKAFIENSTIGWGLPALDFSTPEAESLLREKVNFYAKFFDGFRVDAAWTYAEPNVKNYKTGEFTKYNYGGKILDVIEDEVKRVKGQNYDLKNITYEFAASPDAFKLYENGSIKPFLKDRMKIHTSEYLSDNWGSSKSFKDLKWKPDEYILGVTNHDSHEIKYSQAQEKVLKKMGLLEKSNDFLYAKFAEPYGSKNNMIFFMQALGIGGQYKDNSEALKNYTAKIPADYEEFYHSKLQSKTALNPMDALERQFISKGLDKENPKLFKKIKKYRKILQQKEKSLTKTYIITAAAALAAIITGIYAISKYNSNPNRNST